VKFLPVAKNKNNRRIKLMGEAKRRKILDPNFGKLPRKINYKIPSSVPQDYLRYNGFKPCFGYVYMVQFKDSEPCLFTVNKHFILRSIASNTFSFSLDSSGVATVEMKDKEIERKFHEVLSQSEVIKFVAYPNYSDRYRDQHGLSVIPFNIKFFVDDIQSIDIDRRFYIGIQSAIDS
jgi:hypothetical protein